MSNRPEQSGYIKALGFSDPFQGINLFGEQMPAYELFTWVALVWHTCVRCIVEGLRGFNLNVTINLRGRKKEKTKKYLYFV